MSTRGRGQRPDVNLIPLGSLPVLYTEAQVARYLAVSERTVKRLVLSGQLRALRVGGRNRVAEEDLRAYVERLQREAQSRSSRAVTQPALEPEDAPKLSSYDIVMAITAPRRRGRRTSRERQ